MISTTELRIGNLIGWNSKIAKQLVEIEVYSIMQDKIAFVSPNIDNRVEPFEDDVVEKMGIGYKQLEELDPILLTSEILLEKCGFEKVTTMKHTGHTTIFLSHHKFADLIWDGDSFSYKGYSLGHIKGLHQLQNLYFALSGEELEVNL